MKFNYKKLDFYDNHWDYYSNLLKENIPNVSISNFYKKNIYDNGQIVSLKGLYEESFSDTGGPFFIKVFKLDSENGLYISGFVNNPGKPKYILLKELEIIINNITIKRLKNE